VPSDEDRSGTGWLHALLDTVQRRLAAGDDLTPARAAALYLAFGGTMLVISDVLLPRYVTGPALRRLQTVKGGVQVLVSAGFIYAVTAGSRHQLKRVNERLARNREELEVLHRILRHNLRNKMNVVTSSAASIAAHDSTPDGGFVEERCAAVRAAAEDIVDKTETANRVQRLSDLEEPRTFDIVSVVEDRAESLAAERHVRVTVDAPERAPVEANPMAPRAIEEVLTNAVEHNDATSPEVSVSVEKRDRDAVAVEVVDDGPGIPREVRDVVLEGNRGQLQHLTGLGLWFVYWTVQESGGDVEVETADYEGTCVRLSFPNAR
jgi:signal transduction histidine kinase